MSTFKSNITTLCWEVRIVLEAAAAGHFKVSIRQRKRFLAQINVVYSDANCGGRLDAAAQILRQLEVNDPYCMRLHTHTIWIRDYVKGKYNLCIDHTSYSSDTCLQFRSRLEQTSRTSVWVGTCCYAIHGMQQTAELIFDGERRKVVKTGSDLFFSSRLNACLL